MLIDVEVSIALEDLPGKLRTFDLFRDVIAEWTVGIALWFRDKVTTNSDQYTVWLNHPCGCLSGSARMVDDLQPLRCLQSGRNCGSYLGRNACGWSRPRGEALGLKQRFVVGFY